jgi:hypothetical protein
MKTEQNSQPLRPHTLSVVLDVARPDAGWLESESNGYFQLLAFPFPPTPNEKVLALVRSAVLRREHAGTYAE